MGTSRPKSHLRNRTRFPQKKQNRLIFSRDESKAAKLGQYFIQNDELCWTLPFGQKYDIFEHMSYKNLSTGMPTAHPCEKRMIYERTEHTTHVHVFILNQ